MHRRSGNTKARSLPRWDADKGRLLYRGKTVIHFVNGATLQAVILDAFEAKGWPTQVPDPLADGGHREGNTKARLRNTVKNLNRSCKARACAYRCGFRARRRLETDVMAILTITPIYTNLHHRFGLDTSHAKERMRDVWFSLFRRTAFTAREKDSLTRSSCSSGDSLLNPTQLECLRDKGAP
jgi:hypothetical protein